MDGLKRRENMKIEPQKHELPNDECRGMKLSTRY